MQMQPDDPEADWTSPGVYDVGAGVYRIPLPLPQDGLRAVNVYAVRDGDGLTLVASGWAITEARDLLEQAVKLLDSSLAGVKRFLVTHVHRDHYSLASTLRREFGMRVTLGRGEAGTLRAVRDPDTPPFEGMMTQLHRGGGATPGPPAVRRHDDPAAPGRGRGPGADPGRGTGRDRAGRMGGPGRLVRPPAADRGPRPRLAGPRHPRAHPRARGVRRRRARRHVRRRSRPAADHALDRVRAELRRISPPRLPGLAEAGPRAAGPAAAARPRPGRAERAPPGGRVDRPPRHP